MLYYFVVMYSFRNTHGYDIIYLNNKFSKFKTHTRKIDINHPVDYEMKWKSAWILQSLINDDEKSYRENNYLILN